MTGVLPSLPLLEPDDVGLRHDFLDPAVQPITRGQDGFTVLKTRYPGVRKSPDDELKLRISGFCRRNHSICEVSACHLSKLRKRRSQPAVGTTHLEDIRL
jgi:hypothetical protein